MAKSVQLGGSYTCNSLHGMIYRLCGSHTCNALRWAWRSQETRDLVVEDRKSGFNEGCEATNSVVVPDLAHLGPEARDARVQLSNDAEDPGVQGAEALHERCRVIALELAGLQTSPTRALAKAFRRRGFRHLLPTEASHLAIQGCQSVFRCDDLLPQASKGLQHVSFNCLLDLPQLPPELGHLAVRWPSNDCFRSSLTKTARLSTFGPSGGPQRRRSREPCRSCGPDGRRRRDAAVAARRLVIWKPGRRC